MIEPQATNPRLWFSFFHRHSREYLDNLFGYTSLGYDYYSGYSHAQARDFDSSVGRFINEDTYEGQIDNPLSLNLYTYVRNNPLRYMDPSGHKDIDSTPKFGDPVYGTAIHMQVKNTFQPIMNGLLGPNAFQYNYKVNYVDGTYGYADFVINTQGTLQVYELKPITYYKNAQRNIDGKAQLSKYVNGLNLEGKPAVRGVLWKPAT